LSRRSNNTGTASGQTRTQRQASARKPGSGSEPRSSSHCDLQRWSLHHAFGNDPFNHGRRLATADRGQGFERGDLLRDGAIDTEAAEPPTQCFQGRNGRDQGTLSRLPGQSWTVGDARIGDCSNQRSIVQIPRDQRCWLGGSNSPPRQRNAARGEQIELLFSGVCRWLPDTTVTGWPESSGFPQMRYLMMVHSLPALIPSPRTSAQRPLATSAPARPEKSQQHRRQLPAREGEA
jgi:hypothetical protein